MIIKGYINTRAVLLVLSFFCVIMSVVNSARAQTKTPRIDTVTYKGNIIILKEFPKDTTDESGVITGSPNIIISQRMDSIISVNGVNVIYYSRNEDIGVGIYDVIIKQLEQKINTSQRVVMPDTYIYSLYNVVVDTTGKIVYHDSLDLKSKDAESDIFFKTLIKAIEDVRVAPLNAPIVINLDVNIKIK